MNTDNRLIGLVLFVLGAGATLTINFFVLLAHELDKRHSRVWPMVLQREEGR